MTCPLCAHAGEPAASSGDVAICAGCGASLVPSDDAWRTARASDTRNLTVKELARLRDARGKAKRKEV